MIKENNLAGTVDLHKGGTRVNDKLSNKEWEDAVQNEKVVDLFRVELNKAKSRSDFTDAEPRRLLTVFAKC
jgi:hypothetical protein